MLVAGSRARHFRKLPYTTHYTPYTKYSTSYTLHTMLGPLNFRNSPMYHALDTVHHIPHISYTPFHTLSTSIYVYIIHAPSLSIYIYIYIYTILRALIVGSSHMIMSTLSLPCSNPKETPTLQRDPNSLQGPLTPHMINVMDSRAILRMDIGFYINLVYIYTYTYFLSIYHTKEALASAPRRACPWKPTASDHSQP